MRTQATFRWTSEDPDPALTLTGLIADGLAEAGFGCTEIEDLDYAEAISRLSAETTTLEAAQQSFVLTQQLSLFNYF